MKKKIAYLLLSLLVLVFILLISFQLSPRPGAFLIGQAFKDNSSISDVKRYEASRKKIQIVSQKSYPSRFNQHTYDLYLPKKRNKPLPLLIWVHGGGFVSGDKKGVKEFATRICADETIAVVAMNYEVAPFSLYPNQVKQVAELMTHLFNEKDSPFDFEQVLLGGDSAGAQIAFQYAALQTNRSYAKQMAIALPQKETIKGVLSYCGPLAIDQLAHQTTKQWFMKFFVHTVAWSLLGTKNWKEDERLKEASIIYHLTEQFPPTYLTDGNMFSFQEQGLSFEYQLKKLGIPVNSLFFKDNKTKVTHEYQFNYKTKEAKKCYQQTQRFIRQVLLS